jgi:hypothetical protein
MLTFLTLRKRCVKPSRFNFADMKEFCKHNFESDLIMLKSVVEKC